MTSTTTTTPTTTNPSSSSPILLSIDIQTGMVVGSPDFGPRSTPSLEKNVPSLLSHFRNRSWPIIHIQHDSIDPSEPDNPISAKFPETYAIHPIAAPKGGETVLVKHTGSAFVGTGLVGTLDGLMGGSEGEDEMVEKEEQKNEEGRRKSRTIVVMGMDGGQCVNSTVRHGTDLGYRMVVAGDAVATYGTREWDADGKKWSDRKEVGAEMTHRIAMALLEGYVSVKTTEGVLRDLV